MDVASAQKLNGINAQFYNDHAASFAATRKDPWPGWERLIGLVGVPGCVLDLGAGNMRFEHFLLQASPELVPEFYCVDSCAQLADETTGARFQLLDFVDPLLRGNSLGELLEAPLCDLSVSFGVMHHVPDEGARRALLKALVEKTRPDGHICVSFWRFMEDRKLAAKARKTTERALVNLDIELGADDYLLGWQDFEDAYRYCHHFTDDEIDSLVSAVLPQCDLIDRFESDGRLDAMNTYVILQRHADI